MVIIGTLSTQNDGILIKSAVDSYGVFNDIVGLVLKVIRIWDGL